MGAGQFCTNPGIVVLLDGESTETLIAQLGEKYAASPCGTLLGKAVMDGVTEGQAALTGGGAAEREGYAWSNTLMRVDGKSFSESPEALQTEVFGNTTLLVVADDVAQVLDVISHMEGNLTGSIYSATDGSDDELYDAVAPRLRPIVGRLINDKMPTGVAVSPAMNHGGPFPATGQAHFTAVGIPASLRRFTMLASYDNVRPHRLPAILQG
jgi:NADP-dependent aldehyde dehydrogenase